MEHGPSTEWGEDKASGYKSRLGLWMFAAYCIVYAGFVVISSVWPKLMGRVIGSTNLAVVYGFGLIAVALILAIVYNSLSSNAEFRMNDAYTDDEKEEF